MLAVRISAPTDSPGEFAAQYCRYFGVDVVFLPTEGVQPPGREVRFVFALADGRELVRGRGVVVRMRRDSGDPLRPPGMELRYQLDDPASEQLVARMIELRTAGNTRRPDPPPYVSMAVEAPRALPANPLADVPVEVLALFVEYGLRPIKRRSRFAAFSVGMAAGAAAMALGGAVGSIAPAIHEAPPLAAMPAHLGVGSGGAAPVELPPPKPAEPPPPTLRVRSHPSGARVRVDGAPAGTTPLEIVVAPGRHRVAVEHARYLPAELEADSPGRVEAQLERPRALLRIVSSPPGARVVLDGHPAGVTPLAVETSGFERHEIAVDGKRRRIYLRPPAAEVAFDPR